MLGIAALAFIVAYGRMTRAFGIRPVAILAILALLLTYLSAMILGSPFDGRLLTAALAQFAFNLTAFVLGVLLGRWLDRGKDFG